MRNVHYIRLCALALLLCCCFSALSYVWAVPTVDPSLHVFDYAGLLTLEEEAKLDTRMEHLIGLFSQDIVIVCIDDNLGLTTEAYADDFYDYNDFGMSATRDGILLLLDMDSRGIHITTTGKAIDLFSDADIDNLLDNIVDNIAEGYYNAGFARFLNDVERHLSRASEQPKVTPTPVPKDSPSTKVVQSGSIPTIAIAGSLIVTVLTFIYYTTKQASSLPPAPSIATYTYGTFRVKRNTDLFLRTHTHRTAKPKEHKVAPRSSSSSTRTHTSSSGTRHGGGSRSFSSGSSRSSSSGRSSSSSRSSSSRSSSSRSSSSGTKHGGSGRKF